MDISSHLQTLGKGTLLLENIDLNLKIEKALMGKEFVKIDLLCEVEGL